jgi:hypothetical protein
VGVAVDGSAGSSAGDVYVVDQGNDAVKKFGVSGGVAAQSWKVELPAGASPNQATVDDYTGPDEGDVFVTGLSSGAVYEIDAAGSSVTEVATGLAEPTGVAVDAAGDFFVSLNGGSILEFNASWEAVEANGLLNPDNTVVEGLSGPQTVAVSADGQQLYAATGGGAIQFMPLAEKYAESAVIDGASANGVDLGPEGNVFVDQGGEVAFYEPSGALLGTFGAGVLSGGAFGVAVSTGVVYVADRETGKIDVFEEGPAPEMPGVLAASDVKGHSAVLHGQLVLGGGETRLKYYFEYETGASCAGGHRTSVLESAGAVSAEVTGLSLRTEYTFCLHVENKFGKAESAPVSFETDEVGSENAPAVTAREVTVTAEIATDEEPTTYLVQYGVGSVEENSFPSPEASLPGAGAPTVVQQVLKGLEPGTTYRYRFVASNGHGLEMGEENTFTTPAAAPAKLVTALCGNERLRAEQPYGRDLPDCRAYEMVSPVDTSGQDAAIAVSSGVRAALAGEAVAYASAGPFANPSGAGEDTELLSRRGAEGWSTQAITPLQEPRGTEGGDPSYEDSLFTPELTAGVATSTASLAGSGVPANGSGLPSRKLYLAQFGEHPAEPAYSYLGELGSGDTIRVAMGASSDLSHVVFGERDAYEWVNGSVLPVGVANNDETVPASVGDVPPSEHEPEVVDAWRAVSFDGSRVYFTSPAIEEQNGPPGQLYVRVNADQPQSVVGHPEANATGTLTEGSNVITAITPVHAAVVLADVEAGSTVVTFVQAAEHDPYPFAVGQSVTGPGIPAGARIVGVSAGSLTLSATATTSGEGVAVTSTRADGFVVGERVLGFGLAVGATVTGVGSGSVTLSAPADVSGSGVEVSGGGECLEASGGCTVEVSASERPVSDTHGLQAARYWGASVDGSRVFFTSNAELTSDAKTGPADNAANLYEYDLERPAGERLRDLTVDAGDTDGAGVLGVVQVSEDGEYVYFVAKGALAAGAVAGEANLYVTHGGGAPVFIATLAAGDEGDWHAGESSGGPATNTAVVDSSGARLAFMSERSLTGYDNQQAEPGECERHKPELHISESGACREVFLYDAETGGPVVCVSCNASGARPQGPAALDQEPSEEAASSYRPRNFSEDGALFFDSAAGLVSGAAGGVENVYEYEGGRVYPISDVTGSLGSFFLDASASGGDVFFASGEDLVSQDTGQTVMVYDARVGGGFPAAAAPPSVCGGESCRPAESAQPLGGPLASSTFTGGGNVAPVPVVKPKPKVLTRAQKLAVALKACRKDKKKAKRESCEKRARSRYGPAKKKAKAKKAEKAGRVGAGNASSDGGAGR